MPTIPIDPQKPYFWWIFSAVTCVSVVPVVLSFLLLINCKIGSCAAQGMSLSVLDLLTAVSTWFAFDLMPRVATTLQLLGPFTAVALGTLAGSSAMTAKGPEDDKMRFLRRAFGWCFGVVAVCAAFNLAFYKPANGLPPYATEMARLIGEKQLVDFIVDSNNTALQSAISNFLILLGIVHLKQNGTNTPGAGT